MKASENVTLDLYSAIAMVSPNILISQIDIISVNFFLDNFKSENCKISSCASTQAGCAIMGYKAHKYHPNGKYFLDTTKTSPFC